MKQIKKLFSKLTKFFVKPMVLPVMLLFTSFGFGLRPVHAKSNQIEQSFTVSGKQQPLSSTKALELLIKNQEFFDNQKLSKKTIKINKLTPTKGVLRRNIATQNVMKLFGADPALKVLLIAGGSISVELLSIPDDTKKYTWVDLLIKPKGFIIRNKIKIFGSIVMIGLVCYTIREKQYLVAATKKILELVQTLEFTSSAFEILKKRNQELMAQISLLTKVNQDLVSKAKSTLDVLRKAYGNQVTSKSEIAELQSLLSTVQSKFLECQIILETDVSIPEFIRIDTLERLNAQQDKLILRLSKELRKLKFGY
jgi:hypothetical protein